MLKHDPADAGHPDHRAHRARAGVRSREGDGSRLRRLSRQAVRAARRRRGSAAVPREGRHPECQLRRLARPVRARSRRSGRVPARASSSSTTTRTTSRSCGSGSRAGATAPVRYTTARRRCDTSRTTPPDLILLDVMMPEISGIEVARRIKANDSLPFIPIIMQTALDSTEDKVEGLEAGADDYITKPIDFAELKARLRSMLRIKRLQEALEERERELLEVNERLRHMSQTDGLTGLDNRRHLNERLEEMFQHARAAQRAVLVRHVRPGPLQERQRHLRASGRRRGAQAARRPSSRTRRARSIASAATAARSSCSCSPAPCSTPP